MAIIGIVIVLLMFVFVIQNRTFNHESCFPGLSFGVTGSHGQELFKVAPNHGRIFLAEQVVLSVEEYTEQNKQENDDITGGRGEHWVG